RGPHRLPPRKPRAHPPSTEAGQPAHVGRAQGKGRGGRRERRDPHPALRHEGRQHPQPPPPPQLPGTPEPCRTPPYANPTGDIASARADKYTTNRPRRDGRAFRKVETRGIPESRRAA